MFVSKIVSNTSQERKEASSMKEPELMLIRKYGTLSGTLKWDNLDLS